MTDSPPLSAAQKVLAIPELLTLIIYWISEDTDFWHYGPSPLIHLPSPISPSSSFPLPSYPSHNPEDKPESTSHDRHGALLRCALVSQLWFSISIPFLWSDDASSSIPSGNLFQDLIFRFSCITPARRQLYADFVEKDTFMLVKPDSEKAKEADEVLKDVKFPRLKSLWMIMPGFGTSYVPKIDGKSVEILELDPSFDVNPDTYRVGGEELEEVLVQVAVSFSPFPPLALYSLFLFKIEMFYVYLKMDDC